MSRQYQILLSTQIPAFVVPLPANGSTTQEPQKPSLSHTRHHAQHQQTHIHERECAHVIHLQSRRVCLSGVDSFKASSRKGRHEELHTQRLSTLCGFPAVFPKTKTCMKVVLVIQYVAVQLTQSCLFALNTQFTQNLTLVANYPPSLFQCELQF